jgi:hypothetical protein
MLWVCAAVALAGLAIGLLFLPGRAARPDRAERERAGVG